MARIKGATMTHKRRKKMLKLAKGFYGCKSKHFKMAKQQVMKSGNYALAGRRMKKRQFRNLWICRINNAVRPLGTFSACGSHQRWKADTLPLPPHTVLHRMPHLSARRREDSS